jgi:predicted nucleic acid-binding Zn ribbon protein
VIDYWKLVKDYAPGDLVQRFAGNGDMSPFVGRVTAVHKGTGFLDIQWPQGNERVSAEDIVKVNPEFARFLPPSLNFSWYPGLDVKQAAGSPWRSDMFHPEFYHAASLQWLRGANEVSAYDELWHRFGSQYDDELLRAEVSRLYAFSRNATILRMTSASAAKQAAYWVAQNRQYRVTQNELQAHKPNCPKCSTQMRRTIYKMDKGARARLFACPKCLFLVKRDNLLSPDGAPVEW